MAVLRKLGAFVLGSLVVVTVAGLTVHLLARRNQPGDTAEVVVDEKTTEPAPDDSSDPTAMAINPHRFCCVPRDQINPLQVEAVERELVQRWPELRSVGRERVAVSDRVAFVVEAGTSAVMRDRELLTGTALTEHDGKLLVGVGCEPRLGKQHGLSCESLMLVPRAAIVGWTKADAPERPAELGASTQLSLARFVGSGEPIELVVHTVPGMQWATEPADAARVDVLEQGDGLVTIALRGARPGRLDLVATAEHQTWGTLDLGRWPIVVVARERTIG